MDVFHTCLTRSAHPVDDKNRTADFVASSGGGVATFAGQEFLRIQGMSLKRFEKNPVVLDSHRRESADDVIGVATVRKDGQALLARIRFATDEKSDRIFQKVKDGILRAVSIGFTVDPESILELEEGEEDGEGDEKVEGPAVILGRSELHEISVVPVPADEDALRRAFYQRAKMNYTELPKTDDKPEDKPEPVAESVNFIHAVVDTDADDFANKAAVSRARADARKAAHDEIRAICPADLQTFLDALLLEDVDITFESARRALLAERNKGHKPVGTPEPTPVVTETPQPIDAGDLFTSITGS